MANDVRCRRGSAGFTLVEVLVSLAILALIGIGVSAISFSGVISIKDTTAQRQDHAVAAQFASIVFARDVQGASGIGDPCAATAGGTHLVTLTQSAGGAAPVEYRRSSKAPYDLIRVVCDPSGAKGSAPSSTQVLVDAMKEPPKVSCDTEKCEPGSQPREVTLSVPRSDAPGFELVGTRRTDVPVAPDPPTPTPSGPTFLALGAGTPLQVSGSAGMSVTGDALFNLGSGSSVIELSGNPSVDVSGEFALQEPGTCNGCEKFANKAPGGFPDAVADPLASLPAPDTTGMPVHKACRAEGSRAVCSPGVYEGLFPSSPGWASDYELEPGVYVLKSGLTMAYYGTLSGDGVMLYTANGAMSIGGSSRITLVPPSKGPYEGVSVFQGRAGNGSLSLAGNASLTAPDGMIYGPTQHLAMSGSSRVEGARMVTRSVAMSGDVRLAIGGG